MPIYEYVCDDCGHQLEALQKLSDAPLETCPECRVDALKKKISAPLFRLSGSGWYETDFKADNQRNVLKSDDADTGGGKDRDKVDDKGKGKGKNGAGEGKAATGAATSPAGDKPARGKGGGAEAAA